MNYEIERKLNDKVDKWELHNVHNQNRELKNKIDKLETEIDNLRNLDTNRYCVLERLLNLLAEHHQFSDISVQIYELRGSL